MTSSPYRWAAITARVLAVVFLLFIFLQAARPFGVGVRLALPVLLLTAGPYLYVMRRLARDEADPRGLGFAAILAVVVILVVGASGFALLKTASLLPLVAIPVYALAACFVGTQVALLRQAVAEMHRGPGVGRSMAAGLVPGAAWGLMLFVIGGTTRGANTELIQQTSYSESVAKQHLMSLFQCLIPPGAQPESLSFPASEEGLRALGPQCWNTSVAPGGDTEGPAYEFRYRADDVQPDGTARGFVMETRSKAARGYMDSWSLDDLGNVRRSQTDWATVDGKSHSRPPGAVTEFIALAEAYRELHGVYPESLTTYTYGETYPTGLMPLAINTFIAASGIERREDGALVVMERKRVPLLVYVPPSAVGSPDGYRLLYRGKRDHIGDLRNVLVDERRQLHVTAAFREATVDDPVDSSPELTKALDYHRHSAQDFLKRAMTPGAGRP